MTKRILNLIIKVMEANATSYYSSQTVLNSLKPVYFSVCDIIEEAIAIVQFTCNQ